MNGAHAEPGDPGSLAALTERAVTLVKGHPECLWFRHAEARLRNGAGIRLVVEPLREYGDRRAWCSAQELHP